MSTLDARDRHTASTGRIKLHLFVPSGRRIMTVVGKREEHWIDVNMRFCSCSAFYFATTRGEKPDCYHLRAAQVALDTDTIEKITFDDEEFDGFVRGMMQEM